MRERVLVDAELAHRVEAVIGRDRCVAVVDHAPMRRRPADPERAGHLGDGVEVLSDAPEDSALDTSP